jgi:ubiquitin-conjugating enzyme E2 M
MGLMTLFLEPNADDPLNKEAADMMVNDKKKFEKNVYDSLRGVYVANHAFTKLL